MHEPWVAVANSSGGGASLRCPIDHPGRVSVAVFIDSTIRPPHIANSPATRHLGSSPVLHRDSGEELLRRLRLVPDDPRLLPYVAAQVAGTRSGRTRPAGGGS